MDIGTFLIFLDWSIYTIVSLSVLYLLFFVVASRFFKQKVYPESANYNRILVLYPAYKEDKVILLSMQNFLKQTYPKDKYELVVISDHMQSETNTALKNMPITFLEVPFEPSSKAKALNFAMSHYNKNQFDVVTILDADNLVEPSYLSELNNAYSAGSKAIQTHRIAKNLKSEVSVFDAVSEEVNNSIFRKGHSALGLSAALVGSGMAFDFDWFQNNVANLFTAGEDKELEALLLKQSIFIDYLDTVYVLDEKISQKKVYYSQRQRWLSAQYTTLFANIKNIPLCIRTGNLNYLDKIIQWMLLPRVVLFGLTTLTAFSLLIFAWESSIKWFVLLLLLFLIFALATPWALFKKFIYKSWKTVPVFFVMMVLIFFKINKGKTFIHTPHGQD